MPLYHVQVYMPASLQFPKGEFALKYTEHAMREANRDRYGKIAVPAKLNTYQYRIIEVETDVQQNITKIVYKGRYDRDRDLVIVAIPNGQTMTVKTVWINEKFDNHRTLDRNKYDKKS